MTNIGALTGNAICFIFLALWVSIASATQCYFPDGSPSPDVPCQSGSSTTWCCASSAACLDNGLCLNLVQPYQLARGSCTNKDGFGNPGNSPCPNYCTDTDKQKSNGVALVQFSPNKTHSTYCCDSLVSDHDDLFCSKPNTSVVSSPTPMELWKTGAIIPGFAALSSLSSSSNSSPYVQNSTSGSSASSTGAQPNTNSKNTAIGAGVGVPLGVLLVLALAWGFVERRRRKKLSSLTMTPQAVPSFHDSSQSQKTSQGGCYSNDIDMGELSSTSPTNRPAELYEQH